MAITDRSMISRLKVADTVDTTRETDNGLIVPCIKEPDRIAIDRVANEGLIVPCIEETDGFITPCVSSASGIRFERAVDDGLIVPCVREADVITIAVQNDIFIRSVQAGTDGEVLMDYPVSDRPYWDQNSRDTYDPAPEVTVSGRPLYYSGEYFLIA